VYYFYSGAVGIKPNEAPHVNKDSTPFSVFMLYFSAIIHLLVEEMNPYYHQYLDRLHDGSSLVSDVTDFEMFLFPGFTAQMVHDGDRLTDYWSTTEQFPTSCHSNTMKHD
jgi:hypothetical protein